MSVVADNRPGAGTAITHTLGARAAPDGYTLLLGSSSGLTTNPAFGGKLDYDPVKDFAPVGVAAIVPQLLVVHPTVPAKSMSELIDLAKAQPGKITIGSPGNGPGRIDTSDGARPPTTLPPTPAVPKKLSQKSRETPNILG